MINRQGIHKVWTENKKYFGDRRFYKETIGIALPIALQSLITIGVNLLDNVMLGSLGEITLSASTLAVQFISFYSISCMGLGMGASVLVSRFWGKQDLESLRKVVTWMLRFTFAIGFAFTCITTLIPSQIMRLYIKDAQVIHEGAQYLTWSIPCFLLMGFSTTCTIVLRSTGQVKIPFMASVGAFFINIVANWVFIFGNLGAPRLEIRGAALGTVISRVFEFAFIFGYFIFVDQRIGYRLKHITMKCRDSLKDYLTISIPVLVSDVLLGLGTNVVAMVMGRIGFVFVAANSITAVTQQLSTTLIQGIAQAGCIITGQCIGRGEHKKAKVQAWTFLMLGLGIGLAAGIFIIGVGEYVIRCYNIQEETKQVARQLMQAIGIIVVFQSANSIITKGVLRGGGDTKCLMIADNIFLWVASIPLGYLAALFFHWPAFWIYVCLKIDQFLKTIWCVYRLKSEKWIKNIDGCTSEQR